MKNISLLYILILFVACCDSNTTHQESINKAEESKKNIPQLAILGTFHFANSSDYGSIYIDNIYSQHRQSQIEEVVNKLSAFNPTKILIEREPHLNDSLNLMLQKYINGNYTLPKNELYQIGFRLVKKMNLNAIYGVDYQMDLGDAELAEFLSQKELMNDFQEIIKSAQVYGNSHGNYLKTHSLNDELIELNKEESDHFNKNLYLDNIINISTDIESPEIEYVSNWFKRNLHIKKNIDQHTTVNERILVIIGAGHKAILKDFYENSSKINYVYINDYLTN